MKEHINKCVSSLYTNIYFNFIQQKSLTSIRGEMNATNKLSNSVGFKPLLNEVNPPADALDIH